jgi:hypothetical protein
VQMPLTDLCSRLVVNEHPLNLQLPSFRLAPFRPSRPASCLPACHREHQPDAVHEDAE